MAQSQFGNIFTLEHFQENDFESLADALFVFSAEQLIKDHVDKLTFDRIVSVMMKEVLNVSHGLEETPMTAAELEAIMNNPLTDWYIKLSRVIYQI